MDDRTLAYIAGVVDLLGLIKVRELDNGTRLPVVQMHGNFMPTLEYLAKLTGTKAVTVRREYVRAGCAEHCQEKHMHVISRSGRWSLTGVKATVLLYNIRPFLRIQTDNAAIALSAGLNTRFKVGAVERMRELGWEIPDLADPEDSRPGCSIAGCPGKARKRGWCNAHYIRWQRYDDPLGGPGR